MLETGGGETSGEGKVERAGRTAEIKVVSKSFILFVEMTSQVQVCEYVWVMEVDGCVGGYLYVEICRFLK